MRDFFYRGARLCYSGEVLADSLGPPRRKPEPAMNAHLEMNPEEVLRMKLEMLRREHRDLDVAIAALVDSGHPDQLRLVRLKKQKLSLKDQISRIEDRLTPDIIA